MTDSMICITNRKLCEEPFLDRIRIVAGSAPKAIILREKDLTVSEYEQLAQQVASICDMYDVPLIYHNHPELAIRNNKGLHMPLNALADIPEADRKKLRVLGASCHSIEDAVKAQSLGCTYIIAGHIYDTDCKKGIPGRGTDFLKNLCEHVHIPVYAIGGITPSKMPEIISCGAAGGCMMSGYMQGEILK
ncbi:thiamine phosphate synthase [Butyrivibrio fibrisolvens]|uniref:thiamine phosphate synthase n=1 Tax=Butyrivibrio fibrisolvens TaxID=831 RepID=UPI0003B676A4|nr:thiamine phosphate synthase [Butyrivibrio fibrisolvens]